MDKNQLIVMLTHNDRTVENAVSVFEKCRNSGAKIWGMKETGLPVEKIAELFSAIKECGKTTVLEVVAYEKDECLKHAEIAKKCRCDILMGTRFFDEVNDFCKVNSIKYMPFVGNVVGRPSILSGSIREMIEEAQNCLAKGVYGFDLLGYRYDKDPEDLMEKFISAIPVPVCIAGNINSFARLNKVISLEPWAFTIGGAFFEKKFGETVPEQIEKVCKYIEIEGQKNV